MKNELRGHMKEVSKKTLDEFEEASKELMKHTSPSSQVVDGLHASGKWGLAYCKVLRELFDGQGS